MTIQHSLTQLVANETDLEACGMVLAHRVNLGDVLSLSGPLGVGKTTFVRGFLRGLGFHGKVKSPTYTLVEPYEVAKGKIFHFDFYRIEEPTALLSIGIEEYFSPNAICLVEWPEYGNAILGTADLACYFAFAETGRRLCLTACSLRGEKILEQLR